MILREVKINEYSQLSDIHQKAFEDFFLTTLGNNFLNAYYKACIKSPETVSICILNDKEKIVGFCIGCILSKGFHKRLILRNKRLFFFQGLSLLFSKPKALFRLFFNLDKNPIKGDDGEYAELLSIGVLPEIKNMGIGRDLIYKFEEFILVKGCKNIALTTDYFNNDSVLKFYKNAGYKIMYDFQAYPNRRMFKLIKNL